MKNKIEILYRYVIIENTVIWESENFTNGEIEIKILCTHRIYIECDKRLCN